MIGSGRRHAALVSISLLATGGSGPSLDEAQDAWQRAHPADYVFEYQRVCVCPRSGAWWRVTVRRDSVVEIQQLDSTGATPYSPEGSHPTLTQLFDGIRK